jgi:hypothetical protein
MLGRSMNGPEYLAQALALLERALELLDKTDSALWVTPHLDLAIHRLREAMELQE